MGKVGPKGRTFYVEHFSQCPWSMFPFPLRLYTMHAVFPLVSAILLEVTEAAVSNIYIGGKLKHSNNLTAQPLLNNSLDEADQQQVHAITL